MSISSCFLTLTSLRKFCNRFASFLWSAEWVHLFPQNCFYSSATGWSSSHQRSEELLKLGVGQKIFIFMACPMSEWFNFLEGGPYPSAYYEHIDTVVPTRQGFVNLIDTKWIKLNGLYYYFVMCKCMSTTVHVNGTIQFTFFLIMVLNITIITIMILNITIITSCDALL